MPCVRKSKGNFIVSDKIGMAHIAFHDVQLKKSNHGVNAPTLPNLAAVAA